MDDALIQRCLLHGKFSRRFFDARRGQIEDVKRADAISLGLKSHCETQFKMRMRHFVDDVIKRDIPANGQADLKNLEFRINEPQLSNFYSARHSYRRMLLLVWPDWCNPMQWISGEKSQYCYSLGFSDSPFSEECPLYRQAGWWLRNFPNAKEPFYRWLENEADQFIGFLVNAGREIKPSEIRSLPYSVEFLDYIEPKKGLGDLISNIFERCVLPIGDSVSLSPNSQDIIRDSLGSDWVQIHYDKFYQMKTTIEKGAGSVAKNEKKGKGDIAWNPIDEEPPQDPLV